MKRRIGGFGLGIIVALACLAGLPTSRVLAVCSNVSSFGAVKLAVPELPDDGEWAIWVRMQSPTTSARVLVEANGGNCLDINSSGMTPNQWSWQAYRTDDSIKPIKFGERSGNSMVLFGVESGIKVDKVMLTRPDCVPTEFGNNCVNAVELTAPQTDTVVLPPPSNEAVHGLIVVSPTPEKYRAQISTITYTVEGRTVQTLTVPAPLDTTLLSNGKHTVLISTKLTTGQEFKESTIIEVDNPENPFTPLVRWVRLNQRSMLYVAGITGAVLGSVFLVWLTRRLYLGHRERRFHGF